MKIGLNALVMFAGGGIRNAGVSRYTRNLTGALIESKNKDHDFVVFANSSVRHSPYESADKARFVRTNLPTSRTSTRILWEQFALPFHTSFRQLDVVHSFLNVSPLLSAAAQVVTIHDLSYLTTPWAHPHAAADFPAYHEPAFGCGRRVRAGGFLSNEGRHSTDISNSG